MPEISVIVPVYKVEQYLHRCVDSILNQTYKDFELILVDDGSPDNCGKICDEYARQDSRVVVIHQENGGLSAARNAGIDWAFANSDSQWLFFVDSDDFIHPMTLESLLNAAENHNVDISIGGFERTTGEAPIVDSTSSTSTLWDTKAFFLEHNVTAVVAWGKLYRKPMFRGIRYPVGRIHEDEFTTHKLLFQCDSVSVIHAPLYAYYVNENGIMGSQWSPRRLDATEAFEERIHFFERLGDSELRNHSIRQLAHNAAQNFHKAKAYPVLQKKLRKKLQSVLLQNKRIFSFMEDDWLFDTAFPRTSHRLRAMLSHKQRT